jgi:hypothetical protein
MILAQQSNDTVAAAEIREAHLIVLQYMVAVQARDAKLRLRNVVALGLREGAELFSDGSGFGRGTADCDQGANKDRQGLEVRYCREIYSLASSQPGAAQYAAAALPHCNN